MANKIFFPPSCVLNYFQCKCNYSCRTLLPRYMKCQQSKHIFHTQTMEMMNKAITLPTYVTLPYTHTTHIRVRHSGSIHIHQSINKESFKSPQSSRPMRASDNSMIYVSFKSCIFIRESLELNSIAPYILYTQHGVSSVLKYIKKYSNQSYSKSIIFIYIMTFYYMVKKGSL